MLLKIRYLKTGLEIKNFPFYLRTCLFRVHNVAQLDSFGCFRCVHLSKWFRAGSHHVECCNGAWGRLTLTFTRVFPKGRNDLGDFASFGHSVR